MKLEIGVIAGAESKAFLVELTRQIDRLEKLGGVAKTAEEKTEESTEDEEEEFEEAPKKRGKKRAEDFGDDEPAAEEEEAPKKGKKKKLTLDDVNDACKARVKAIIEEQGCTGQDARSAVLKLLKKKFDVKSVSDLEPEQYEDVIIALESVEF